MSKQNKVILGLLSCWPIVYLFIFFVAVVSRYFATATGFDAIVALHLLTMLVIIVLLFIYIRDLFKTDRVVKDKKTFWAVVLFLGNVVSMPIYWYLYIWREPQRAGGQGSSFQEQNKAA